MMSKPDIVLIHGFWVTPRSWEEWIAHYEAPRLHRARARVPRVRGRGGGAQRRPVADRGRDRAADHRAPRVARRAASTRRRSSSGTRRAASSPSCCSTAGHGAAGVAINSAPTEGVKRVPLSQVRATFPVLQEPGEPAPRRRLHRGAVALRVHEHVQRGGVAARSTSATTSPRRARSSGAARSPTSTRARTTRTSTTRTRTARRCCSSPAARTTSCRRRSSAPTPSTTTSATVTEVKEFAGPHLLPAAPGWEEVADYALDWALEHAR